MRKPALSICKNKCADQQLCFHYIDRTVPLLPKIRNFKSLVIFCGCTARFVSDLVGNPEDRFLNDAANFIIPVRTCIMHSFESV